MDGGVRARGSRRSRKSCASPRKTPEAMPVFVYKAADRRGQTIDGVMDAPDARAVVERLQKDAYYPIKITAHGERAPLFSLGGSRVGQRDLLAVTLRRLAEFIEARAAFNEAVISALIYPLVITLVGAGAVVFLMTFVIPRFATIFRDLNQAIPLPTQILLTVSGALQQYWWVGMIVVLAGVVAWRVWTATPEGRLSWDRAILNAPIFGGIALHVETARFARTLGTMLRSGVPVLGPLAVVGDMLSHQAVGGAVSRLSDGVKRGGTIAAGMQEQTLFPSLAIHMVRVGEETGRMEEMLLKVADTFETDVRIEMKRTLGLLEPTIILVMGVLVAFIVVAMLMAIFSINEVAL